MHAARTIAVAAFLSHARLPTRSWNVAPRCALAVRYRSCARHRPDRIEPRARYTCASVPPSVGRGPSRQTEPNGRGPRRSARSAACVTP
ncbi:hypothetical protein WS71_00805 [Burkholderia mayonis]|uniref:Uncharacterized protein n=1 Tax=Burkholderia mayonis TaxID=1385591 RepID=A0A1B4FQS8_9BURK|nr:hypothetical protein WS71_00805 [Burkholderia mayonis]KVE56910.1 hypothetical protein WS71_02440 [Burkholderia mayonis]